MLHIYSCAENPIRGSNSTDMRVAFEIKSLKSGKEVIESQAHAQVWGETISGLHIFRTICD